MTPYKPAPIAQINTFSLLGHTLTFAEPFKEYNAVREAFNRRAYEAREEMASYYESQITDASDLVSSGLRVLDQINRDTATFAVSVLMHYGIDHVSANELMQPRRRTFRETDQEGNVTTHTEDYGKEIANQRETLEGYVKYCIQHIDEAASDLATQRSIERSSRSKWVGGGYGIRGAIAGAVKAGALNAGTSVLRGIGDSVTDAADAAKIRKLGREVAKDPEIKDEFLKTPEMTADRLMRIVLGYLTGTLDGALPSGQKPALTYRFSEAAAQKARARLENYVSMFDNDQIGESEFSRIALECMMKDMWNADAWVELYMTFMNEKQQYQIIDVMPYLGMQYLVGRTFIDIDRDYPKFAKENGASRDLVSELKADVAKRKEYIEFQMIAPPERLAEIYVVQAYVRKNGFYVATLNGGVGSMKQEEYALKTDPSLPQSLPIRLLQDEAPFTGTAKLTTSDYVYSGSFSDGYIQGKGKIEYEDGESFEGMFDNGTWVSGTWSGANGTYEGDFLFADGQHLRHGAGKSVYPGGIDFPVEEGTKLNRKQKKQRQESGRATVKGTFQNNRLEGPVQIFSSIMRIDGQCTDHLLEGKATVQTPEFKAEAQYEGGRWVYGSIRYDNGDVYRGEIANPDGLGHSWARAGRGTCTFATGEVYEGEWQAGRRHGFGTQRNAAGETYVGQWENGLRQGMGTLTDASGVVIYEGEWNKDKRKGSGMFSKFFGRKK